MATKGKLLLSVLNTARGEIGQRESNNNSGKRVMEYQAATTLGGTHFPWCSAFTCWLLRQAAKANGIEIPWSYSASCDVVGADAKARGLIRSTPQAGDFGLVRAKLRNGGYSKTDFIHIFIVESVEGNQVKTIEGNSNSDGGREGVAVVRHTRPVSERLTWVRWIDAVHFESEAKPAPWTARLRTIQGTLKPLTPIMENGTNLLATSELASAAGVSLVWNAQDNEVILDDKPIAAQPRLIGGKSYFSIRVLAEHLDLKLAVDGARRLVTLG